MDKCGITGAELGPLLGAENVECVYHLTQTPKGVTENLVANQVANVASNINTAIVE